MTELKNIIERWRREQRFMREGGLRDRFASYRIEQLLDELEELLNDG